jgi:hypothetical protein
MKTSTRISRAGFGLAVATLLLALHGCGSSKDSTDAANAKKSATDASKKHIADPGNLPPADMVAAVSAGKGGPPVELKFELRSSPQAGQALTMDFAILPAAQSIERVNAKFQGSDGLELVDGGDMAAVDKPAQGSVIRHVIQLVPKQDGIYTVTAAVSVDLASDSITRTFTIPLIVGEGLPELTANSDAAGRADVAGPAAARTGSKTH